MALLGNVLIRLPMTLEIVHSDLLQCKLLVALDTAQLNALPHAVSPIMLEKCIRTTMLQPTS